MSDDLDDLFGDNEDEEQQEQPEQDQEQVLQDDAPAAAEEVDYGAGLEDDMGDEAAAGAGQQQDNEGGGAMDADEERELFGGLDDDDEDAAHGQQEERGPPIDVRAPLLPRPAADKVLLMKVPNIIRIDPRPYDPNMFDGGVEEMEDETGKIRVRPKDINVIRWRYRQGEDGQLRRESNARYVKWSDGTESIVLGDEVLNVDRKEHTRAHTYLYAVRYDVIEGQAHLSTRLTVAPASLNSKIHKRLKMTVQQAAKKVDKVRMHYAARNPEMEKAEAEKRAQEAAQLKAARERAAARPAGIRKKPTFTAAYLEDDYGMGGGYEEEEQEAAEDDDLYRRRPVDEEEEEAAAQRLRSAKRTTPPPAAAGRKRAYEQEEEEEEEAAEEPAADAKAPGLKVRRGAILDDDDD